MIVGCLLIYPILKGLLQIVLAVIMTSTSIGEVRGVKRKSGNAWWSRENEISGSLFNCFFQSAA